MFQAILRCTRGVAALGDFQGTVALTTTRSSRWEILNNCRNISPIPTLEFSKARISVLRWLQSIQLIRWSEQTVDCNFLWTRDFKCVVRLMQREASAALNYFIRIRLTKTDCHLTERRGRTKRNREAIWILLAFKYFRACHVQTINHTGWDMFCGLTEKETIPCDITSRKYTMQIFHDVMKFPFTRHYW